METTVGYGPCNARQFDMAPSREDGLVWQRYSDDGLGVRLLKRLLACIRELA